MTVWLALAQVAASPPVQVNCPQCSTSSGSVPGWALLVAAGITAAVTAVGWFIVAGRAKDNGEALEQLKSELGQKLGDTLAQRTRRADYLRTQIEKLYGPLAFYTEATARASWTWWKFGEAFEAMYIGNPKTRDDERGRNRAIALYNRYSTLTKAHDGKLEEILRDGWAWLDTDDIPDVSTFLLEKARRGVERNLPRVSIERASVRQMGCGMN
jgi:hypothetical protein